MHPEDRNTTIANLRHLADKAERLAAQFAHPMLPALATELERFAGELRRAVAPLVNLDRYAAELEDERAEALVKTQAISEAAFAQIRELSTELQRLRMASAVEVPGRGDPATVLTFPKKGGGL